MAPIIEAMGGRREPWLDGYRVRVLDGSHLPGTEHRIKPLRTERAGALPGQALVVLDPELMLVLDAIPCEDGHAQERSMTEEVLAIVRPGDLWVGDRNFCTTSLLFGIAGRGGSFVIRQHASTLSGEAFGSREAEGRCETGAVFEQPVRLTGPDGKLLVVRRVTVELDKPTRDGDREIHILTDLPEGVADSVTIADLYRKRWTLETAFQEIEATLNGEIDALGYPRAALFALSVALVAYNVMSAVKGALRSVHGPEAIDAGVSGSDLAEEVSGTTRGMLIAIQEGRVDGVPWTVPLRDGSSVAGPRAAGAPVALPETTARAEEAEAQEGQWLREETPGNGETAQRSTNSQVMPPTQGWVPTPQEAERWSGRHGTDGVGVDPRRAGPGDGPRAGGRHRRGPRRRRSWPSPSRPPSAAGAS